MAPSDAARQPGSLESMRGEEPEEEAANALSARLQARTLCERSVVKPQKGVLPC
jgi:hypothetical protein